MISEKMSRRTFLHGGAALAAGGLAPGAAWARGSYRLRMDNAHTGESFNHVIVENGRWVREALAEFDWFARDWREGETYPMSQDTLEALLRIQLMLETSRPFTLLSGYRTLTTNQKLPGAVRNSLHLRGMALDITHPDRSVSQISRAAMRLRAGGVGRYPRNNFVHIDSGRVRTWVS